MAHKHQMAAVVVDNGTSSFKAGFSAEDDPLLVFPPVMATLDAGDGPRGVDEEALTGFSLGNPVHGGIVKSWDDLEAIWSYVFRKLQADPRERPVLMTESLPFTSSECQKMTQIMFESLDCSALYIAQPAALSLFSSGRTTGLVLDGGASSWRTVPVSEGHVLYDIVGRPLPQAGTELTDYMKQLLRVRGHVISQQQVVQDIMAKLCYVALDCKSEKCTNNKQYELPDGKVINLGEECFRCPEALFQPSLLGMDTWGITESAYNTIIRCEQKMQGQMFNNMVLSGGCTLFPGIEERIHADMTSLAPPSTKVKVIASPERKFSVWKGGSLLASLPAFMQMCVTKEEYEEIGPSIVQLKCF